MPIERALVRDVAKPWGSRTLMPWHGDPHDDIAIGELWFNRADPLAPAPGLLMKLLFTEGPLSIQVHPTDAFARSIGLAHGKTEAWHVLSARPDARIALGLTRRVTPAELRAAVIDGSIETLVDWRPVQAGDTFLVPAGVIHAIGPGLSLVEIQQNSDSTFRMFDHGQGRVLQMENALAVADCGPAPAWPRPRRLNEIRQLLVSCRYFVLERVILPARSKWEIRADQESWLMVLDGAGRIGEMDAEIGQAFLLEGVKAGISVGARGMTALVAYAANSPRDNLLRAVAAAATFDPRQRRQAPSPFGAFTPGGAVRR